MFLQKIFQNKKYADIVIVGLGNPGKEFQKTPHNAGFQAIDLLLEMLQQRKAIKREEHTKEYALYEARIQSKTVVLVKPLLFMNRSGQVTKKILSEYTTESPQCVWIVHDDIDLSLSSLRISFNSQSAGNKGVQSIIDALERKDFYRFRIGVRPNEQFDPVVFVTKQLQPTQQKTLAETVNKCVFALVESIATSPQQVQKQSMK